MKDIFAHELRSNDRSHSRGRRSELSQDISTLPYNDYGRAAGLTKDETEKLRDLKHNFASEYIRKS